MHKYFPPLIYCNKLSQPLTVPQIKPVPHQPNKQYNTLIKMRLSANILQSAEQRTNPIGEREILLRSMAIPAIEHLAVTRDQFDTIDLSNNHITNLDNFPKLERLSTLYLGGNDINNIDAKNIKRNVPNIQTLIMTGNGIKGWNVINDLGVGCKKLEFLSLVGNPVTSKLYLLYVCVYCFVGGVGDLEKGTEILIISHVNF